MTSMKCIQSVINSLVSKKTTNFFFVFFLCFTNSVTPINNQVVAGFVRLRYTSLSGPYGVTHLYLVLLRYD